MSSEATEKSDSRQPEPKRWYVLAVMSLCYAAYSLDKNIIGVLIEPIKHEFGLSDSELSLLSGMATTLPFAIACIPFGILADRVVRKWLLVVLVFGWSAATGLAGFATTVAALFWARVVVGALESGFLPSTLSLLGDNFPAKERATATGVLNIGVPLGMFLGMWIGGYIAAEHGWRMAFFVAGVPGVFLAGLMAMTVAEPPRGHFDGQTAKRAAKQSAPFMEVLRTILRNGVVLNVMIGMVCCASLLAAMAIWTPSLLVRVYDMPLRTAGLTAAVVIGLCGALGAAAGGGLSDVVGRRSPQRRMWVPILGSLITIIGVIIVTVFQPPVQLAVVLLGVSAFFGQFFFGTGYAAVIGSTLPHMRATTFAILQVVFNIASYGFGVFVVGAVSDATVHFAGSRSIALGIGVAALISLWGVFHFLRAMRIQQGEAGRRLAEPAA